MLKILYACSQNINSAIQLQRFLRAIENKPYIIRIAAYKNYSPKCNVDYTLDSLYNIFNNEINRENIRNYYEIIKSFKPDLIISDLNFIISKIAIKLNIKLWQCNSHIAYYALLPIERQNLKQLNTFYKGLINIHEKEIDAITYNSDKNYIYSHLGDLKNPPKIYKNFEWIRPYHKIARKSAMCKHKYVGTAFSTKKIISFLLLKNNTQINHNKKNIILFSNSYFENIPSLVSKNIEDEDEYYCNLKNCDCFFCEGQESILADAYYNNKHAIIMTNLLDTECIISGKLSEVYGLATQIYNKKNKLTLFERKTIQTNINNIKYLHEKIDEL